jgi:hypothetical protein
MNLNISYDPNTLNNAPAAFFSAVNYVRNLFGPLFTNNVTVNVEIGYGTFPLDNSIVPALGESEQNHVTSVGYSQVVQHLVNGGAPGSGTLSASSPIPGFLTMGSAQEKALGLLGASNSLDGWVGVASDATVTQQTGGSWSFSPTAVPGPTQYYLVGVLEHEITEVMGRSSYLDEPGRYGVMDLYRFAAPGVHQTGTGSPAYFSLDGGTTNLATFNNSQLAAGDLGDWAASVGADAFLNALPAGQIDGLSTADITLMQALGWTGSASPSPLSPPSASPAPAHIAAIQLNTTHQVDFLAFSGTSLSESFLLSTPLWNVVGSGDFNQDGRLDLVTQGPAGQVDLIYLSYAAINVADPGAHPPYLSSFSISATAMADNSGYWPIHGSGNFGAVAGVSGPALVSEDPGSGIIDLLWFRSDGRLAASNLLLGNYWDVRGAGDFHGDGHMEIVTQSHDGQIDLLTFTGSRLSASELVNGSYWPVMATDDMNHDGRADITVQNSSTGQIDHLFFTGATLTASQLDTPAFPGSAVVDASLSFNHLIPLV